MAARQRDRWRLAAKLATISIAMNPYPRNPWVTTVTNGKMAVNASHSHILKGRPSLRALQHFSATLTATSVEPVETIAAMMGSRPAIRNKV